MRVLGLRCTKDDIRWAVVEGDVRDTAQVVERDHAAVPNGLDRGAQLAWVRQEVLALLGRVQPDAVALRVNETGGQGISLGRSEVDGVVQEACASAQVSAQRMVAASVRARFGAKNNAALSAALTSVPAVEETPKTGREPVVAAAALLPKP